MCRSIRVLHHFDPPTTPDEIRAAALQFVRKVSGATRPNRDDEEAFARAVEEVTATTERLLAALRPPRAACARVRARRPRRAPAASAATPRALDSWSGRPWRRPLRSLTSP